MSTVFKKFSKSDISIIPFSAHKQSTFTSASLISNGGNYYSASFPTVAYRNGSGFEWANSGSANDPNNHKKYFQLDHLFYRNSKLDYGNKFSTIKYNDHYRVLYDNVNILSLPYKTIGYKLLGNLSRGLFISPYSATSLQEYFATGFEEYYLNDRVDLKRTSSYLYNKIVSLEEEIYENEY